MKIPVKPLVALLLAACLALPTSLQAAIEIWTNLDGQKMQAEFLGRKADYVSFKKPDGSRYIYPYAKLTAEDQARIDALTEGNAGANAADSAAEGTKEDARPAPSARSKPGTIAIGLEGKLVTLKNKNFVPASRDRLNETRYVAFYYSAHWCPPCRAFTPDLVSAYKKLKDDHPEFELIFVSSDRDEKSMKEYMVEYDMEWPALRRDQSKTARVAQRPDHERGIPNLVFMDANGKELSVSYTSDGEYRGPREVLKDIKKHFDR